MEMKQYLIDTFKYNDFANRKVLEKIRLLPDKARAIEIFSHLINSQDKWLARFEAYPQAANMSWWQPVYPLDKLETEWRRSLGAWLEFIQNKSEEDLFQEAKVVADDSSRCAAPFKDIALQLNYHSIHHRANIQSIIRAQGLEPDFIDYIGTVYRRIE